MILRTDNVYIENVHVHVYVQNEESERTFLLNKMSFFSTQKAACMCTVGRMVLLFLIDNVSFNFSSTASESKTDVDEITISMYTHTHLYIVRLPII